MLSRLYRRAESLNEACLRAWGFPTDHSVRQELMDALEWEGSLYPGHARESVRHLFDQVQEASRELADRLRESPGSSETLQPAEIQKLRERLGVLMQVLANVRIRGT
jgi:hypothetical protein